MSTPAQIHSQHHSLIHYGLVGDGQLARHLHHYFELLNIPHSRWSRKMQAAGRSPRVQALAQSSVVLLAVSDRSIESVATELKPILAPETRMVHFSGSLFTPLAIGFHPLMTFGEELYDLERYESISFIGEKTDGIPNGPDFKTLFPALRNASFRIEAKQKSLYHALCVLSGNFTALLWTQMLESFPKHLGLPAEVALPYLKQVCENLIHHPDRPRDFWTGPLVRADQMTIEKNLHALTGNPYQDVYRAFVSAHKTESERK